MEKEKFLFAAAAALAPLREVRDLLPGNKRRPADVFLCNWAGGLDAALDVTFTQPSKMPIVYRAGTAATPGHALTQMFSNKCRVTEDLCREQGLRSSQSWRNPLEDGIRLP